MECRLYETYRITVVYVTDQCTGLVHAVEIIYDHRLDVHRYMTCNVLHTSSVYGHIDTKLFHMEQEWGANDRVAACWDKGGGRWGL